MICHHSPTKVGIIFMDLTCANINDRSVITRSYYSVRLRFPVVSHVYLAISEFQLGSDTHHESHGRQW
jgi:hypothetical protein